MSGQEVNDIAQSLLTILESMNMRSTADSFRVEFSSKSKIFILSTFHFNIVKLYKFIYCIFYFFKKISQIPTIIKLRIMNYSRLYIVNFLNFRTLIKQLLQIAMIYK